MTQAEKPFGSWNVSSMTFKALLRGVCGLRISSMRRLLSLHLGLTPGLLVEGFLQYTDGVWRIRPVTEIGSGSTVMPASCRNFDNPMPAQSISQKNGMLLTERWSHLIALLITALMA